ncbi:preprotein translocase subunit SecY [Haloarcula hispanica N601]|uniref:Protein translocase subunit SecY n=4 Tax=Haloarcula hispanica TaxID=51589 RepID=A0A482T2H8_HALHI|nr:MULTISPECIES: preprotein translocase subunit SecY [Haloarcula]AEM57722.1 preprotein translocase subunit SecY [Haloarcula hispanica ATCC 33960]AHB66471.1 preprotein translocase subunit SecY [Haloarcula hispanica N601]KAA9406590.1 preprotein translocase subunit SecY [Haloarcula sp. CBA1131]KAA9410377.1 preprotein translocase subunit SecY [Haloarcula hispanica]KZX49242.1 preprotein translocase subunit SecY [Haloarcula sp. K1]
MSWKDTAEPLLVRMPAVQRPDGHVPFKRKLTWTGGVLLLYFFLTNVKLFGLDIDASQQVFGRFSSILASGQGSIMQLGIGPIVTASIVLQLLGGADLLGLNTQDDPRDQILYQGLQKLLVLVMICLTGLPMVFAGGFLPADTAVANSLGIGTAGVQWLIFAQMFVGGVLILFMDEVISKWGVGSGIGLFIVAGVSQRLIGGILTTPFIGNNEGIIYTWYLFITGERGTGPVLAADGLQTVLLQGELLGLFTTVLIFAVVVYAESVRVEIPLSNARVKGARGRFPVKLIYASVLPMILVRALQANIQFLGRILNAQLGSMPAFLGTYANGQPTGGLFYFLAPIQSRGDWMWWLEGTAQPVWQILTRVGIDLFVMLVGGAVFAVFWVETTDMGPEATAKQIHNSGMQIPGFRQNVGVIEKVLERYIPQVTVIGGALVGLLAVMANMLGTIGGVSGTGLLLTVSITYKLYEEIAEEQLMEMHPMMRQMFG